MEKEEKIAQIAISLIPNVGSILGKQLIGYCGSAMQCFSKPKSKLQKIPGVGLKLANELSNSEWLKKAHEVINKCNRLGINLIAYGDSDYPEKLKMINDAPLVLYCKGEIEKLNYFKTISIVGRRKASSYGRLVTQRIVEELKAYNCVIVSGLAYGIDIISHRASIKHNIPTYGVLANGLDIVYPSVHKHTADAMVTNGGLLSENPPATKPEAYLFPARNRIIAGLCDALIVVEAATQGGALITAEIADSYNKEIFAVPGNIDSEYSSGTNNLIKNHKANIFTDINDLELVLGSGSEDNKVRSMDLGITDPTEKKIIDALIEFPEGLLIDELSWKCQIAINEVASQLLNLEFRGVVRPLPGKKYKLS